MIESQYLEARPIHLPKVTFVPCVAQSHDSQEIFACFYLFALYNNYCIYIWIYANKNPLSMNFI